MKQRRQGVRYANLSGIDLLVDFDSLFFLFYTLSVRSKESLLTEISFSNNLKLSFSED